MLHCHAPVGHGPEGLLLAGEGTVESPETTTVATTVARVVGTEPSFVGLGLWTGASEAEAAAEAAAAVVGLPLSLPPTGPWALPGALVSKL
jgi:hypothetical protein